MTAKYRTKYLSQDNKRTPETDVFCIACHKDLDTRKQHREVHLVDGGPFVLHPDDEGIYETSASDVGFFYIGGDCAKKLGIEWTH